MTDKEKLIELLRETEINKINGHIVEACVSFTPKVFEAFADHLLANGVTFATDTNVGSKWISVEDRLPEEDLHCLVFQTYSNKRDGYVSLATYFPRFKGLEGDPMNSKQAWCKYSSEYGYYDVSESVTHWMPMPKPPKEA